MKKTTKQRIAEFFKFNRDNLVKPDTILFAVISEKMNNQKKKLFKLSINLCNVIQSTFKQNPLRYFVLAFVVIFFLF